MFKVKNDSKQKAYKEEDILLAYDKLELQMKKKTQKFLGWILLICGIIVGISALPRPVSEVVKIFFFEVNLGTQLDIIRLLMCIALVWVGWRGIQEKW